MREGKRKVWENRERNRKTIMMRNEDREWTTEKKTKRKGKRERGRERETGKKGSEKRTWEKGQEKEEVSCEWKGER